MKYKPWQLAVVAIAGLLGVVLIARGLLLSDEPEWEQVAYLIDVESGELFRADTSKMAILIPARSPSTGKIALVRIDKSEGDKWAVLQRDMGLMDALDVKPKSINAETGEVLVPVKDFATYTYTPAK